MDLKQLRITQLESKDSIRRFKCGETEIDSWASSKAAKWTEQNRTKVFIGHHENDKKALGFYSLSFSTEDQNKLTNQQERDRYPNGFPILYIGYLAVDRSLHSNGIGTILLLDALKRSHWVSKHVAFYGVGLRSLNEKTTKLYTKFGFGIAPNEESNPLMVLPIWTLNDLFNNQT